MRAGVHCVYPGGFIPACAGKGALVCVKKPLWKGYGLSPCAGRRDRNGIGVFRGLSPCAWEKDRDSDLGLREARFIPVRDGSELGLRDNPRSIPACAGQGFISARREKERDAVSIRVYPQDASTIRRWICKAYSCGCTGKHQAGFVFVHVRAGCLSWVIFKPRLVYPCVCR